MGYFAHTRLSIAITLLMRELLARALSLKALYLQIFIPALQDQHLSALLDLPHQSQNSSEILKTVDDKISMFNLIQPWF